MNYEGRRLLITGSNRGIGQGLVEGLLKRGVARIYATARDIASLPDFGDARVIPLALDVTDQAQVDAAAAMATDVDLLINNAGVIAYSTTLDGSMEEFRHVMEVNHWGTLRMMRAFVPILEGKPGAALVNIASMTSVQAGPFHSGYSASKAAVYSITQSVRIELAKRGIAVHAVMPGPIDTDMAKELPFDVADLGATIEEILDQLADDVLEVLPDDFSREMFAMWREDHWKTNAMVHDAFHGAG